MPTPDVYGQGISLPVLADPPNAQTIGASIGTVVPQTVMRFASAAGRAAVLTGAQAPTPGMVTYLIAEDRYEGYTVGQGWTPLTPGPWIPIPLASGRTTMYAAPEYRIYGNNVELRGSVAKSDSSTFYWNGATNEATGLANDWLLGTLPSGARPTDSDKFTLGTTEMATNYYCRIQIRATNASSGQGEIHANIPHIAGQSGTPDPTSGPHWISLDNIAFPLT